MSNILIVMTSHDKLGETGKATGFHYEEMTTPYWLFRDAGHNVTLTSIKGGEPPHDPGSLKDNPDDNPPSVKRFLESNEAKQALQDTQAIADIDAGAFNAVYLPGGHGTMWDFPNNAELNNLISTMYEAGKPVAAVCHGPAGLIGAEGPQGQPLVNGKCVNCFTDAEEKDVGLDDTVPFLLESALRELGARFEASDNYQAHVAKDDNLITGQNPASAAPLAEAVLDILKT